jgi:para-aminobenzoate synthetase component 1
MRVPMSWPLVMVERLPALDGVEPAEAAEAFADLPGLALLESSGRGLRGRWSFLAADPVAVLQAATDGPDPLAEARALLARLATLAVDSDGGAPPDCARPDGGARSAEDPAGRPPFAGGLLGYLAYDLGRRFEPRLESCARDGSLPELRLALHDWTIAWDRSAGLTWLAGRAVDSDPARLAARLGAVRDRAEYAANRAAGLSGGVPGGATPAGATPAGVTPADVPLPSLAFRSETGRSDWIAAVEATREEIARGELYQANLSRRLAATFDGDPWPLFRVLRKGEPAAFSAYLDLGRDGSHASPGATGSTGANATTGSTASAGAPRAPRAILSASPEAFLSLDARRIVASHPIKGTRPRGRTPSEDRALARELIGSAKDRAENTMIVDVLRNDLGRVCRPGTVRVPRLWRLERAPAVQHLVSTITGRLAAGRDAFDLIAAAFPGGSVTGAPKIRAMELIDELEPVPRGPYTGAAIWIDGDGAMGSSILIRTFVADGRRLTLHVGGGITWRSDAAAEWDETVAKARGPLAAIGGIVLE